LNQISYRERLAAKPTDELLVVRDVHGQDLHRHGALQDAVRRLVDARHATGPQALAKLVAVGDQRRTHRLAARPAGAAAGPAVPAAAAAAVSISVSGGLGRRRAGGAGGAGGVAVRRG